MKTRILSILGLAIIFAISFSACDDGDDDNNNDTFEEVEPNNSFSTANDITMSETYDGEINPAEELDFYKYTGSGDKTITVVGSSGMEMRVTVFSHGEVQRAAEDAGSRGGTAVVDVQGSDYEGFFYIKIESAYAGDTGTYTIKLD